MFGRCTFVLTLLGAVSLHANDIKNPDFASGLSEWNFDGGHALVYLSSHNIETKKEETNAFPAVKLTLSQSRAVAMVQDVTIPAGTSLVEVQIDVFPTTDFKRMTLAETKTGWDVCREMPVEDGGPFDADFWVRGSGWMLKLVSLQPGVWNHVEADFKLRKPATGPAPFHIEFNVSPGTGAVYLTSPSAASK
jgi:hypothetical protein